MHQRLGISDFSWINRLCGENGVLEIAVQDFRGTVAEMEKELSACRRRHDDEAAGVWSRTLRNFRCSKDDHAGKKCLIGFLVRNNVLPKYGFPVNTVELIPDINAVGREKSLQLARDLQMAIAEYAPGAEVVADGKMYVSRYIRKMPGKNADAAWEKGFYCPKCPACGYASETGIPLEHKNTKGYRCINREGTSTEYRLSHDFKTDVAKSPL